ASLDGLAVRSDALPDATPHANGHTRRVATMALQFAEPLPYALLRDWLAHLVADHGRHLLRVKGIVAIRGQDRPIVVHGVQHQFHPPQFLAAWPADLAQSTLVFILEALRIFLWVKTGTFS
ncbi:MAG TPA: GTP-binding protein, partial [Sedimentisphaerales bacterium]